MGGSFSGKGLAKSRPNSWSLSPHSELLDLAHTAHISAIVARDAEVVMVVVVDLFNAVKLACFRNFPRRGLGRSLSIIYHLSYIRHDCRRGGEAAVVKQRRNNSDKTRRNNWGGGD